LRLNPQREDDQPFGGREIDVRGHGLLLSNGYSFKEANISFFPFHR
jgi:hypothetical protein